MKCGLLGRKLGHSYSPQIHNLLGDYAYCLYEKESEEIEIFLKQGDFSGLNVTIPYKKSVIPYLDELTPQASTLGAVNTIVCKDGRLIGHNTDYFGFKAMTQKLPVDLSEKKVLVLGSGGASNTAAAVLQELGAMVTIISRTGENNYENLTLHRDAQIIVNTTPVGMYPNTGVSPVDLDLFPDLQGVLDVIYNPARTKLLLDAEKRGIPTVNGLLMLVAQAKEAAEWFTGSSIPDNKIQEIYHTMNTQMENLILIGMPGCGKSTVGRLVAEVLNKTFVDADEKIVEGAGKTIPEIFAQSGEEGFRNWETRILSDLGRKSGLVIATGGGCVTKSRNYDLLHQNGRIFWLQRDISSLPRDGRPLSLSADLNRMYLERRSLYEAFCDVRINNNRAASDAAAEIIDLWRKRS